MKDIIRRLLDWLDPLFGHRRANVRALLVQHEQLHTRHAELNAQHEQSHVRYAELSAQHEQLGTQYEQLKQKYIALQNNRQTILNHYFQRIQNALLGIHAEDPPFKLLGNEVFERRLRESGWDWPSRAPTMIGRKRLENICTLIQEIIQQNIKGDFIEVGVWRGGACILMRSVLDILHIDDRKIWLADSFAGFPEANPTEYPADDGDTLHEHPEMVVSLEEVKDNFREYGLLDEQVQFIDGWFKDSLPLAPVEQLALLRIDGDRYESTWLALQYLYPKLSVGGYVVIGDYFSVPASQLAVKEYCAAHGLTPDIQRIDDMAAFWQKTP